MKYLITLITIGLLICSCGKDDVNVITTTPTVDPPQLNVNASVIGYVTDESGLAIDNATVRYNGKTVETNEIGLFAFDNEQLFEDGTYISVEKEGFFHGSRKFYAVENESSQITIKLLRKSLQGTYDSSSGGKISFDDTELTLPEGQYKTKSGQVYEGPIEVYAQYIDPTTQSGQEEMPGDLTGINLDGEERALASYGMMVVELHSNSGEELNLPENTMAEISMKVPEELVSSAPSTIPLWHFDEVNGTWIEEGEAVLTNGHYIGEVAHFTFWNCDAPFPLVKLEGVILLDGEGYEGAHIRITMQSNGAQAYSYSGTRGEYSGKVPKDEFLLLEILDYCYNPIHSENIQPLSDDTRLAPIEIDMSNGALETFTVEGTISNCNGDPFTAAYGIISVGNSTFRASADASGHFILTLFNCGESNIKVRGYDVTNSLVSPWKQLQFGTMVDAGNLTACTYLWQANWFVEYEGKNWDVNGNLVGWNIQVDTFNQGGVETYQMTYTIIDWVLYVPNNGPGPQFELVFTYQEGDTDVDYVLNCYSQGFRVEGNANLLVETTFTTNDMLLTVDDFTTNIIQTDPLLYPGAVDDITFNVKFPHQ